MSSSLAEYVSNLLRQGYSEQQIRQTLAQSGYPQSMVDAAFQGGVVSGPERSVGQPQQSGAVASLVSYIQTYLAQGYQVNQLRPYLLQQGYAQRDVDAAIATATGQQTVRHEVHLPVATVLKVAFLIIIAVGLFFGFSLIKGKLGEGTDTGTHMPSELLDVEITLNQESVKPGESVTATFELTNMGTGGRVDVKLEIQLLSGEDVVWRISKTKAVSTTITDTEKISMPSDLDDGDYTVKVIASYSDQEATASQPLEVKSEKATVETPPEEELPPGEDYPEIIVITEAEKYTTTDDAVAAAKRGETAKAEAGCTSISNQARRDSCLTTIVLNDHQASHCDAITSIEERENCMMPFIMEGRYELCEKLTTPERKSLCENLKHLSGLQNMPPSDYTPPDLDDFSTSG